MNKYWDIGFMIEVSGFSGGASGAEHAQVFIWVSVPLYDKLGRYTSSRSLYRVIPADTLARRDYEDVVGIIRMTVECIVASIVEAYAKEINKRLTDFGFSRDLDIEAGRRGIPQFKFGVPPWKQKIKVANRE